MIRILYLFTNGRKKRIKEIEAGKHLPKEFLYGYYHFKNNNKYLVDIKEINEFKVENSKAKQNILFEEDKSFRKKYYINRYSHIFYKHIDYLNTFDFIIAIPDSIALSFYKFIRDGELKTKVIYVQMGFADRIYRLKTKRPIRYQLFYKKNIKTILQSFYKIVTLGQAEKFFWEEEFSNSLNIEFIPFGIDTKYWKNDTNYKGNYILFIGNDNNRDYKLLIEIAKALPQYNFIFITNKLSGYQLSDNITLVKGDWRQNFISDDQIKEYYIQSKCVIIPLKKTIQPSGQSVTLQAMAMRKPVLISQVKGIWDSDELVDNCNIFFINNNTVNNWCEKIRSIYCNDSVSDMITTNASNIVRNKYRIDNFNEKFEKILTKDLDKML